MTQWWMQRAWQFVYQHALCWHAWKPLKYYGLPNEPVLSQCRRCRLIARRLDVFTARRENT